MFLLIQICSAFWHEGRYSLHSNMFLLIRSVIPFSRRRLRSLHSNMFLLILKVGDTVQISQSTLHSNMFLLVLYGAISKPLVKIFTFQYVSINTRRCRYVWLCKSTFTFQYVSINTCKLLIIVAMQWTLHSNMFLLIPASCSLLLQCNELYIPICFY